MSGPGGFGQQQPPGGGMVPRGQMVPGQSGQMVPGQGGGMQYPKQQQLQPRQTGAMHGWQQQGIPQAHRITV